VSVREWNLGQQAITLTKQGISLEEGYMLFSDGTAQRMKEPNFIRYPDGIKIAMGYQIPAGVVAFVHSHPDGSGISPDDLTTALLRAPIRVISAGVGTNLYGSAEWPEGGKPSYANCLLPNGP
jgi:hypothetical protein